MKILTAMNIKKLVCFFVLLALCCTHSFNGYTFADAKDKKGDTKKNGQCERMVCDDREVSGGSSGSDIRIHYNRHVFVLKFSTGHDQSMGLGVFDFSASESSGDKYQNLILSCCIHNDDSKQKCDFSIDDTSCDKYIDRQKGEPYPSSTYYM